MYRDLTAQALAEILQGHWIGPALADDVLISRICTDTRALQPGDVYLALTGERFDGHDFAQQALDSGAIAVVTERPLTLGGAALQVDNTLAALQCLSAWQRQQFSGPVIGVTGSSGKTTVKQLMASVLAQKFNTWMTQGNLNNHIGVPLTLLALAPEHEAAVIEMGASGLGEIAATAQLVMADVAIITNASESHLQGFGSLQGVVTTKGEILDYLTPQGVAVINADDAFSQQWQQRAAERNVLLFGLADHADVRASDIVTSLTGTQFCLHTPDGSRSVQLPLLGRHNVINALAVVAAVLAIGMSLDDIVSGLQQGEAFAGRLQWQTGFGGMRLLDDSYNANPASMCAAIDVLANAERGYLVMGDMGELGDYAQTAHRRVGEYARERGIYALLTVGELSAHAVEAMQSPRSRVFPDRESLVNYLKQQAQADDVVLIKGSRSAQMDKIVQALQSGEEEK